MSAVLAAPPSPLLHAVERLPLPRTFVPRQAGVQALIASGLLTPHFQPIADLASGRVIAHEALIRGPRGSQLASPDALFAAARQEGCELELELECMRCALRAWAAVGLSGKLFVNMSAAALIKAMSGDDRRRTLSLLTSLGVPPSAIVIELTEHERVHDIPQLLDIARQLTQRHVTLALDDFGDGRSSLRLWSELRPALVKIDKYFTANLAGCADRLQTFRALLQLAETFGASLVAEGIEDEAQLRVLRDLGVHLGQGWFIGRPAPEPVAAPLPPARAVFASRDVAVLPEPRWATARNKTVAQLLIEVPPVRPDVTVDEVFVLLSRAGAPHALAVVDDRQRPLALIERHDFVGACAQPYFREVHGRSSCMVAASPAPLCLDEHTGLEELTEVLTASDQRYLRQGFIITRGGAYLGLGAGESLVRAVTETRIEAARHANPLTLLPGNIPLTQHIERLVGSGRRFVAAYFDLDHFKPFNDEYGYWRGDQMIRLVASVLATHCDTRRDFMGHVGGDDFVVLFQSEDWATRCRAILDDFNQRALALFDPADRAAGGLNAEDRYGTRRFHPCTTLCAGAVEIGHQCTLAPEEIASAAAAAKRRAKQQGGGLFVTAGALPAPHVAA
jgi:EAL domain-containing protein (putative c-di-GMP-specific phosphodiesterase class I)/GGDEF domain-containing protein